MFIPLHCYFMYLFIFLFFNGFYNFFYCCYFNCICFYFCSFLSSFPLSYSKLDLAVQFWAAIEQTLPSSLMRQRRPNVYSQRFNPLYALLYDKTESLSLCRWGRERRKGKGYRGGGNKFAKLVRKPRRILMQSKCLHLCRWDTYLYFLIKCKDRRQTQKAQRNKLQSALLVFS